jgi:hypothetical protein
MLDRFARIAGTFAVLLTLGFGLTAAVSLPSEACWHCVDQANGGMICVEVPCDGAAS